MFSHQQAPQSGPTLIVWACRLQGVMRNSSQRFGTGMLRGLYQLGAGLHAATLNQELTAENLANAASPGYRRQGMSFASLLSGAGDGGASTGTGRTTSAYTNFAPGATQLTGAPF